MEKSEKIESIILVVTLSIGGLVSLLDFIGVLDNIDWLSQRVPTLTLILVSLIATSLLVGNFNLRFSLKKMLPDGTIRQFESEKESFEYILRRIQEAKSNVYDLTWESPYQTTVVFDDKDRERYLRIIEDISRKIKYREIVMVCKSQVRLEKAIRLVSKAGKYYELSGYNDLPDEAPPRKGLVIIDGDEVYLGKFSIRHPVIVDYYVRQFDDFWAKATPIKVGDRLNIEFLEKAKQSIPNEKG